MREAKVVIRVVESQRLPQRLLALTQRADPSSDGRHMLTQRQVEALHKGRVDLPARPLRTPVRHASKAPNTTRWLTRTRRHQAYGLDHLGIQQLRQRHPARPARARDDAHDEVDGGALAMQEWTEGLEKRAATGDAPAVGARPPSGLAVGAEMTPAHPAPRRPSPDWGRKGGEVSL